MEPGRKEEAMTDEKARRIARGLQANAEAVHTDAVTWEAFQERNRALWREAEAAGVNTEVLNFLCNHEETPMTKKKTAAKAAKENEGNGKPVGKVLTDALAEAKEPTEGNGKHAEAKPKAKEPKAKRPKEPKVKEPKEDLVVFAFRLKAEERDAIHAAAGPAKASKYVRGLTLAASRGDEKTVLEIVRAVKEHLAQAS
jgi:hypothetical protein